MGLILLAVVLDSVMHEGEREEKAHEHQYESPSQISVVVGRGLCFSARIIYSHSAALSGGSTFFLLYLKSWFSLSDPLVLQGARG